ncbi:MAG: sulfite exporter TauE/SafE family protein [Polyangia bacterium]
MSLAVVLAAVFVIAVTMTMAGRGGGNFYVLVQLLAGVSMHEAASTGQLIMCFTSLAALIVFQKHRNVSWRLALFIGATASVAAFFGGLLAHLIEGVQLQLIFASLLVLAGLLMLYPVAERAPLPAGSGSRARGVLRFRAAGAEVRVDLRIAAPFSIAAGLFAGMVGVSGGSFLVPLMVLACRVPIKLAVGTASAMVGATAGMGFLGHLAEGGVDWSWALPQAAVAVAGGMIGGKLALKTKPRSLKKIFAATTLAAAVFVYLKTFA